MMIVDSLVHVTPDGRWFHTPHDASEDRLLRQLDSLMIDRAVVVALAEFISNDFVLEVCNRHPERLIAGGSLNPVSYSNSLAAAAAVRSLFHESPFRLLKLHPRLNRYDPLDPCCLAVLEEIASWKTPIPVWLDSLLYCRHVTLRKPIIDTVHHIVSRFPVVQFVILHACGSWVLHLAEAVRDCPNAFLDFSFMLPRYSDTSVAADLRYLLNSFDRRIVFGSDFPEFTIEVAFERFHRIAQGVSKERLANVLGGNLSSILTVESSNAAR